MNPTKRLGRTSVARRTRSAASPRPSIWPSPWSTSRSPARTSKPRGEAGRPRLGCLLVSSRDGQGITRLAVPGDRDHPHGRQQPPRRSRSSPARTRLRPTAESLADRSAAPPPRPNAGLPVGMLRRRSASPQFSVAMMDVIVSAASRWLANAATPRRPRGGESRLSGLDPTRLVPGERAARRATAAAVVLLSTRTWKGHSGQRRHPPQRVRARASQSSVRAACRSREMGS